MSRLQRARLTAGARYLEAELLQVSLRWGEAAPIQSEFAGDLRALALCLSDESALARAESVCFGEAAGDGARNWRCAADLWCEWSLSFARRASPGGPVAELELEGRGHVLDALRRAIELGYGDIEEPRKTPALQLFRDDPELVELMRRLEYGAR